jgi:hypothetical protein
VSEKTHFCVGTAALAAAAFAAAAASAACCLWLRLVLFGLFGLFVATPCLEVWRMQSGVFEARESRSWVCDVLCGWLAVFFASFLRGGVGVDPLWVAKRCGDLPPTHRSCVLFVCLQCTITEPSFLFLGKRYGKPTPLQIVLLQELERWNILNGVIATSLADLKRALVGEIGMSESLDLLGVSLFNGYLPGKSVDTRTHARHARTHGTHAKTHARTHTRTHTTTLTHAHAHAHTPTHEHHTKIHTNTPTHQH